MENDPTKKPKWQKTKKILLISGISILVLLGIVDIILRKNSPQTTDNTKKIPTPSIFPQNQQSINFEEKNIPQKNTERNLYDLPYITAPLKSISEEVLDYTWNGNILYYATAKGIRRAGQEKYILSQTISYVNFNNHGQGVLKSDNKWLLYNTENGQSHEITITGENPKINFDGSVITFIKSNTLSFNILRDNSTKDIPLTLGISNIVWAKNSDVLAVDTKANKIHIINADLEKIDIEKPKDSSLLDISPGGKWLAMTDNKNIIILSADNGRQTLVSEFSDKSLIKANWISDTQLIVSETVVDIEGRNESYYWIISTPGVKTYLTNSMPMTNKMDTDSEMKTNKEKTYAGIVQNKSGFWLLGLLPGKAPVYSEDGKAYQNVPFSQYSD